MGHLVSEEYLNKKNIEEYLAALAQKIIQAGIGKHKILIVGGAAMALKFRDERSTVDIDICYREQNSLYECCRLVSEEFSLPEDWINADVMHSDSFTYKLFDNAKLYRSYKDILEVFVVDDLDHYCMKLVSFRAKDIQDMDVLAEQLSSNGVTKEDVINNFNRLYGDEYFLRNDNRKIRILTMQFA